MPKVLRHHLRCLPPLTVVQKLQPKHDFWTSAPRLGTRRLEPFGHFTTQRYTSIGEDRLIWSIGVWNWHTRYELDI
jgi:hypothetical protein